MTIEERYDLYLEMVAEINELYALDMDISDEEEKKICAKILPLEKELDRVFPDWSTEEFLAGLYAYGDGRGVHASLPVPHLCRV